MATFEGKILQADAKPTKTGGTYYRLEIEGPGGSQWWTYFGDLANDSIGATCTFGTRTTPAKGNYPAKEIIDNYMINTPGAGPAPSAAPAQAAQPMPGAVAGHKELWIATQVFYMHAIDALRIETMSELVGAMDRLIPLATIHAIKVNEKFKTYQQHGVNAPLNIDQQAVDQARTSSDNDASAGEPGFDDDIPF